jgi:glycosyltransferase involved in cell wall biosynthesis
MNAELASLSQLRSQRLQHSPLLTVAVRVRNELKDLPGFLTSLSRQNFPKDYQLLFLDSSSTDGTLDFLRSVDCDLFQIAHRDFQFGSSCNLCCSLSKAPAIVFFSGHVVLKNENILETIYKRLQHQECAGYLRQVAKGGSEASSYERAFLKRRYPPTSKIISYANPAGFSNAASFFSKDIWRRCNFPEVGASEDYLWARALLQKGIVSSIEYLGDLEVEHSHAEGPEVVYQRVSKNVQARKFRSTQRRLTGLAFFPAIMFATLKEGASVLEAFRFAKAHAAAYVCPPSAAAMS